MEYKTEKIEKKDINEIEAFIQKNPQWGYENPREFILESLRHFIKTHTVTMNEYNEIRLPDHIQEYLGYPERVIFKINDKGEVVITK